MKHLCLLGLAAAFLSLHALASTEVCIDHRKNTVTLSAHYTFYGGQASMAHAKPCVDEINKLFNNGMEIQLNKDGVWRKVVVNVKYSIMTEYKAVQYASLNTEAKNNYVRIDTPPKKSRVTVSEHGLNSNFGYFIVSNGLGESTTCTHEFAHGLGLNHLPDPCDWRGKGAPPIMAPRGCKVDKRYQYDPKARAGAVGGTINPTHRQVKAKEITAINLGDLKYRWVSNDVECAPQGIAVRKMYNRDGSTYVPGGLTWAGGGHPSDSAYIDSVIWIKD